MKFKSLFYKAACTAAAFTCMTVLPGCSGDDSEENEVELSQSEDSVALEHMQMTVREFTSGEKQFSLRGNVTGAIYATSPGTLVSDTKADNIWGEITADGQRVTIVMNYTAKSPSPSSEVTLNISFTSVQDTGVQAILRALCGSQGEIPEELLLGNNTNQYVYNVTISFNPVGQTFSTHCDVVPQNGTTRYSWTSSGFYVVEAKGTSTTAPPLTEGEGEVQ